MSIAEQIKPSAVVRVTVAALQLEVNSLVTAVDFGPKQHWRQQFQDYWAHYIVSQKNPPQGTWHFFIFFHKRLRISDRFFTHLLNVPIFARLQSFIQLSPILTKLCHIKRDYPVHIICAKCPKCAKTRAFRRLRKSLIALLIVVCGKTL